MACKPEDEKHIPGMSTGKKKEDKKKPGGRKMERNVKIDKETKKKT